MAERFYRAWCNTKDLVAFNVVVQQTDLYIKATKDLTRKATKLVEKYRASLAKYIEFNKAFETSLVPITVKEPLPAIVKDMIEASKKAGVGPMAAVAGAIAEYVGKALLKYSPEVIIENGGDIFIKTLKRRVVGIYAGDSVFTKRVGIEIRPEETPIGVCTSSGTVGHSLSFGCADAVVVVANSALLADAVATATGNIIKTENDIAAGINFAKTIKGIKGVIIIKNDRLGVWGTLRLIT